MGLRQPTDTLRTADQRPLRIPFRQARPGNTQIDTRFIDTLARQNAERQRQLALQEKNRKAFMAAVFENDLDTERVRHEAEMSQYKGINAIEEQNEVKQRYLDAIQGRFAELPEQLQQDPDFQLRAYKKVGQFDRFTIPYVASEKNKVEEEAFKSRIANDINGVVENALDIEYIEREGIPTVERSIHDRLVRQYGDDPNRQIGNTTAGELMISEMRAGVSDSIRRVVQQQVTYNDFDIAEQTVARFFDRITPDDQQKIKAILQKGREDRSTDQSLALAQEAMSYLGNNASMTRYQEFLMTAARGDGDLYRKSLSILEGRQKIIDRQRRRDEERIEGEIYDEVTSGRPLDAEKLKRLPPDRQVNLVNQINANNGGPATVTNQDRFTEIREEIDRMTDEEFLDIDVNKRYAKDLSAQDRRSLRGWQDRVRREVRGDIREGQRWNSAIYKDIATSFSDLNNIPGRNRRDVESIAFREYERLITESPRITRNELYSRIKRTLHESIRQVPKTGWAANLYEWIHGERPTETVIQAPDIEPANMNFIRKANEEWVRRGQRPMSIDERNRFIKFLRQKGVNPYAEPR